jgi:hypothetical protein
MRRNFLFIVITFVALQAYSWGDKGHKIVAVIAEKCLDKSTIDSVKSYLGKMTFKEASVWMDKIKSDRSYDHMRHWHYINIEKDATYVKTEEENVVTSIEKAIAVLKNRKTHSREEIAMAIRMLFHLVGDLHQPLHAGYGADKGGNNIDVDLLGEPSNLHKVWDTGIIEKGKVKDCYVLANAMSKEEGRALQVVDVEKWMMESREYLPAAYEFEKNMITREYIAKNKVVVEKQLVKAGIRLAAILYQAFAK